MSARDEALRKMWADLLKPLEARTIVAVRYMDDSDKEAAAWDRSAVMLILDDATIIWPSQDDEGNGAGALFIQPSSELKSRGVPECAPVI